MMRLALLRGPRRPLHLLAALALAIAALAWTAGSRAEPSAPRLATMDWTLVETLLALGITPAGVAETAGYRDWVVQPPLPAGVREIGLRTQPNLELLSELAPERILLSRMFRALEPRLTGIAPVSVIDTYGPEGDNWHRMVEATEEIGRLVDRETAAAALIRETEGRLKLLAGQVPHDGQRLLVIQFMDANHVRVFGRHGLYQSVLDRLGLENAWNGPTNYWGFALVSLAQLARNEGRLVIVEPLPVGTQAALQSSGLWQALPSVRRGDLLQLPPVWSFGALPSARRFAEVLSAALTGRETANK